MPQSGVPRRPVKTVETTFELLELLKEQDGGTLELLSKEMEVAKSTVHRHLATLENLGFVTNEGNVYYPSLRFLDFAEYTRHRNQAYGMAQEMVEEIAEETDERAQFLVAEHGKGVYVYRATGAHAVRTDPGIGKRIHLHTVAAGKAILSRYPREQVEAVVDRFGLPAYTKYTITDEETLFESLERVRELGYSQNKQENVRGLHAVGVPIVGPHLQVIGALSVSGPSHRMKGEWFEDELPNFLLGAAEELELNIAHS